ncbi:MAG: AbrB/MazE/SpoVT family DNA-binding domain-containing protein [Beijerinckiaceae bacterium]
MPNEPKLVAKVSTKGQMILPAAIRRRHHWNAGTRLVLEETPDGVLLRTAPAFEARKPAEIFGCLTYKGPPKSLEEMSAAVAREIGHRHARGRY